MEEQTKSFEDTMEELSMEMPLTTKERYAKSIEAIAQIMTEKLLMMKAYNSDLIANSIKSKASHILNSVSDNVDVQLAFEEKGVISSTNLIDTQSYVSYTTDPYDTIYVSINEDDYNVVLDMALLVKMRAVYNKMYEELSKKLDPSHLKDVEFINDAIMNAKNFNVKEAAVNPIVGKAINVEEEVKNVLSSVSKTGFKNSEEITSIMPKLKKSLTAMTLIKPTHDNSTTRESLNELKELYNINDIDFAKITEGVDKLDQLYDLQEVGKQSIKSLNDKASALKADLLGIEDLTKTEASNKAADIVKNLVTDISKLNPDCISDTDLYKKELLNLRGDCLKTLTDVEVDFNQPCSMDYSDSIGMILLKYINMDISNAKDSIQDVLSNVNIQDENKVTYEDIREIYVRYGLEAAQEEISKLNTNDKIEIITRLTSEINSPGGLK